MARTLTDEDVGLIANRVVWLLGERLTTRAVPPAPGPPQQEPERATPQLPPRLAYTIKELSSESGISRVSIYRLEARGLLRPNPALRHKLNSRAEVERFLALDRAKW
jgi:hypothetical protein